MIHRAYRPDVGGHGVPTAVPLPEGVFEPLSTVGLSLRMGIGCHLVNTENSFTADWVMCAVPHLPPSRSSPMTEENISCNVISFLLISQLSIKRFILQL